MRSLIKNILSKIPLVNTAYLYRKNCRAKPGSYLSPVVDIDYIKANKDIIWNKDIFNEKKMSAGIDMNDEVQSQLLEELKTTYQQLNLTQFEPKHKKENIRYFFGNTWYEYADATCLYLMMKHFRPERIIEIGSGFSSALMLDVNESEFDGDIELTFIEPNTERLESAIKDQDKTKIIKKMVQNVPPEIFSTLEENDILFIDNSHVSKIGSDVNYLFFEILPHLKKGVIIHIHDVFYPFMYPKRWIIEGEIKHNWNELFILRAFLMYNNAFEILFFPDYLIKRQSETFQQYFPYLCKTENQTIWLRKK